MTDHNDWIQDSLARTKASLVAKQCKDVAQKPVSAGSLTAQPVAVKLPSRIGATKQPEAVGEEVKQDCKEDQVVPFPKANRVPQGCWAMTPDIIRSALFGVVKRGQRRLLHDEIICASGDTEIRFSGMQLDQADMDVFMQALALSKESGLGATVYFTEHSFLKVLKRKTGKKDHDWLKASLKRLSHCRLELKTKRYVLLGGLIDTCAKNEETNQYFLRFNPEFSKVLELQTFVLRLASLLCLILFDTII